MVDDAEDIYDRYKTERYTIWLCYHLPMHKTIDKADSLWSIHHTETAEVTTGKGHEDRDDDEDIVIGDQHGPGTAVWPEVAHQV